ncbi:MAG: zinc ABC transporter substrate-binding protein [Thiohalophilus sp.]|jgi:zinc/manganese transport system substrate-binding protein
MKNAKRFYSLVSLFLLSIVAGQASAKLNVLACEPEWAALAETLGKQHVEVFSATTAFQDPHHIEARPSLIARARQADLLVCTGADLEIGWLPLLLRQSGNARIQSGQPGYFLAAEQVELIEKTERVDRSMGDIHAAGNPHVHLDPYRLLEIARRLTERLVMIDAGNAQTYQENYHVFESRWQTAIRTWETRAQRLKGIKVVVQHRSWSYLLGWLGIEPIADLEPKPGLPPTSGHLAGLLERLANHRAGAILIAAYQNDRGAQWLAGKTGIPVITLPFTVGGNKQAKDLFSLYDDTLNLLLEGVVKG